ncbi:hypothetical protein A3H65_04040 [Candidatus Giovannonibacteria bacterium RIFCSPLOWO2_02_FULL_45_14]|uniref:Methyltransferase type 11 domain-containing protein n=1 Tax=Candidatus Giovannonibacteria bacterium RIFCSPLOWO2_12_FULL_44_15 TaxID=1798364 RepID=A0A1F5Y0P7_9BACT|nr:MAG: hypothetical protein A3C75_03240 [Candidatus Giovannonibacteria bacterium RIFCSPHIGHO2_02_FULL_44_31]OGF76659.1 MAG: hypothetical protein A3E62_03450 [Candidatus Giovannonibacteria bacterium RIFCSPHIGHO2_12_FULL_44_29]OGF91233.1 MAG: hypothetical protein A3H65_04040 [Candidatus Giovannonibacteria bacterium RIFCSPLOWO2_02_FULL_45_14]OGF93745.1 MAG: hypothetical protein A3G54_04310 [Candidatus Giovannonibacteria bacterium RIFCSPLOWO2_12_FULL_44_15]
MRGKILKAFLNPALAYYSLRNKIRKELFLKKIERSGEVYLSYKDELYPEYLFKKKGSAQIHKRALLYCRGRGIDIGAGAWPLSGAKAIENITEENAYKLDRFPDNSLDFVFSSHCLEHLERWREALSLWNLKLKKGGALFLYLPHESMKLWKPREIFGMGHVWSPTWQTLIPFLEKKGMKIKEFEPNRDKFWSFHIAARKN